MTDNYTVSIDCYSMNLQLSIVKSDKSADLTSSFIHLRQMFAVVAARVCTLLACGFE